MLTKSFSGTLTLTGANSYGGGTYLSNGTLVVSGSSTALGASTGWVAVDGPTTILSLGSSQTTGTVNLYNGGTISATNSTYGLTAAAFDVQDGTISAKLTGSGILTKLDVGTVVLTGSNDYTGGTTVSGGMLRVTKLAALPVPSPPSTSNIQVATSAVLALNVGGTGEFTVTDVSNLLAGAVFSPVGCWASTLPMPAAAVSHTRPT